MRDRIFITGSTSTIGCELSKHLSIKYDLILHSTSLEKAQVLVDSLNSKCNAIIFISNFQDLESFEENLIQFLLKEKKSIQHFVHISGYFELRPLKLLKQNDLTKVFSINTFSAIIAIQKLGSKKYNTGFKSAILISSHISSFGAFGTSLYAASKSALDSIAKNLAVELAPVRINTVNPGGIQSNSTEQIYQNSDLIGKIEKLYPLGLGVPSYLNGIVSFLISDESFWITGQSYTVDGGRTINLNS